MRHDEEKNTDIIENMDYERAHTLIYGNKLNVFSGSPE